MKIKFSIFVILIIGLLVVQHHTNLSAKNKQFAEKSLTESRQIEMLKEQFFETEPIYPNLHMVVNVPAKKVTLYDEGKEIFRYDIAIGQPFYKTPTGPQKISTIVWNPWWFPPDSPWARDSSITPPGPNNPLGPVKLPMGGDLRLHGSNKPSSIGQAASHGCLRMKNDEAVNLAWYIQKKMNESDDSLLGEYKKNRNRSYYVTLSTPVTVDIIYEPVELRENILHVYYDIYGWAKNLKTEIIDAILKAGINLNKVDEERLSNIKYPKNQGNIIKVNVNDLYITTPAKDACYEEK